MKTDSVTSDKKTTYRVYSWNKHGNIGDDWIAAVAQRRVSGVPVRERRTVPKIGAYRLSPRHGATSRPLCLWGGGWLAADQGNNDTLQRWHSHLNKESLPVRTFGLGLGPFGGDRSLSSQIELQLEEPILVRTEADRLQLADPLRALVSCDAALLDDTFDGCWDENSARDHVVICAPAWRPHWLGYDPDLTEENYRATVMRHVRMAKSSGLQTIFVPFDTTCNSADLRYWRNVCDRVETASSVVEAAEIIGTARWALCGRLHAGILAAVCGTPTVAIPYHHKFDVLGELQVPMVRRVDERVESEPASVEAIRDVRARGEKCLDLLAGL